MRVIDEKGKLFGKLNIIDLIAIIVVLAVLALLGVKLTGDSDKGESRQIVYTVKVLGVEEEVYRSIKEMLPSQLMAAEEMQEGYVTAVEGTPVKEDAYLLQDNAGSNTTRLYHGETGTYDLVFTIEATVTDPVTNKIGTQEVRVGKYHIVKTAAFELDSGIILSVDELPEE